MSFEFFIARRVYFGGNIKKKVSAPAIKIAVAGIALGLATMLLAVAVVIGFKQEVGNKVVGFGSHIQVTSLNNSSTFETLPLSIDSPLVNTLVAMNGISRVQRFSTKPGIIKTEEDFQGIVLKGVDEGYDLSFFENCLMSGALPELKEAVEQNEALVSKNVCDKLNLKQGSTFYIYFVQDPPKVRKFLVKGVYCSNFEEYDKLFLITRLDVVRKLNGWDLTQVSGLELLTDDFSRLNEVKTEVQYALWNRTDKNGEQMQVRSIRDINPSIFSWLDLLDTNVLVIIVLMVLVSSFTMISGLLIIILERTNMIGILKAMGANNGAVRRIFLYISSFLILKGLLWGNIIALLLCWVQSQWGIFQLDPVNYYINQVPVHINLFYIVAINAGALLISLLMLLAPSYVVSRISPARSIHFE